MRSPSPPSSSIRTFLTVLDSGETRDGQLWFTMPYVEGESLRDRLRRQRQLPLDDALRITREVALALDYAHRHGVVHRDVKPENILLVDGQAMIADFGIARALATGATTPPTTTGATLTETGMSVGTPAYMSPEQAAGERSVDGTTDIYALGAVLYEMLAGEPPFTGPTAQAIVVKMMAGATLSAANAAHRADRSGLRRAQGAGSRPRRPLWHRGLVRQRTRHRRAHVRRARGRSHGRCGIGGSRSAPSHHPNGRPIARAKRCHWCGAVLCLAPL